MKKSVKIILFTVALLAAAGLLAGEIILALHINGKNNDLNAKIVQLEDESDKLKAQLEDTEKKLKDSLSEKGLVDRIKEIVTEYWMVDEEDLEDVDTLSELMEIIHEDNSWRDIHEIWDDTEVIEAYFSGESDGLSDEDKYVLETASSIIDEIITDDMTDYEKELAVYNWQFDYVSYDEGHFSPIPVEDLEQYNYYPYGVLKYHSAICVGNATTFKLFMDMLGIDCKIIHSTVEGEHAWNLVCLDGDWYHVDVTFDGGVEEPGYAYFNVPDSFKIDGGYPWDTDEFPMADGTKYFLNLNRAAAIQDRDEIPQLIRDAIDRGDSAVCIKSEGYVAAVEDIVESINDRLTNDGSNISLWMDIDGKEAGDYWLYVIEIERYIYDDGYYDDDFVDDADSWNEIVDIINSLF